MNVSVISLLFHWVIQDGAPATLSFSLNTPIEFNPTHVPHSQNTYLHAAFVYYLMFPYQ